MCGGKAPKQAIVAHRYMRHHQHEMSNITDAGPSGHILPSVQGHLCPNACGVALQCFHLTLLMYMCHRRYTKSPEMIDMMRAVKHLFDPNNILNPYKVLPNEQAEAAGAVHV